MQDIFENMVSAIELGRTDIVKSILDACSNGEVTWKTSASGRQEKLSKEALLNGSTFLSLATKLNRNDVVRTMLSAGADPTAVDPSNGVVSAVDLASTDSMQQIYVEELLRAIANSELERVVQMLDAGVYVNAWDSRTTKNTPLHWAACYADSQVVATLINVYGAELNPVNDCGATPLHDAVMRGDVGVVEELLKAGADFTMKASRGKCAGKTALDLALNGRQQNPHLAAVFEKYGAVATAPVPVPADDIEPLIYRNTSCLDQPKGSVQMVVLPPPPSATSVRRSSETADECSSVHRPSGSAAVLPSHRSETANQNNNSTNSIIANNNNRFKTGPTCKNSSNAPDNNRNNIINISSSNNNNNNNYNSSSRSDEEQQKEVSRRTRASSSSSPVHQPPVPAQPPPSQMTRGLLSNSQGSSLDLSPRLDQVIENLVRTHMGSPVRPLVTHPSLHLLWPQPQRILELRGSPFLPPKQLRISVTKGDTSVHSILDVWEVHRPALTSLGFDVRVSDVRPSCGGADGGSSGGRSSSDHHQVECTINPSIFTREDAYRIHVASDKVRIAASNRLGLHYAISTFLQLLRLADSGGGERERESQAPPPPPPDVSLIPCVIDDYPAMRHRAILLDVSPMSRVPSLDYLFEMIEIWSSLKISHIHLYTRLVASTEWQLCYKQSELVTMDRYCQDRCISLLPVLDVEVAVTRDDVVAMWPAFQEILATFASLKYVHIGPRLSSLLVGTTERGPGPGPVGKEEEGGRSGSEGVGVRLDEIWHLLAIPPGVTVMLCSNSLHGQQLNRITVPANMVLVEYGFQADYNFLEWTEEYHQLGCTTCLCPGTASWNSLAGCPEASVCNVYRAAAAAARTPGGLGLVAAHWSGSFHLTPHPFAWPGFLVAAGLAWNTETHWDYLHNSLPALLDAHVFLDRSCLMGEVLMELGHAETYTVRCARGQEPGDLSDLPSHSGSTFYRLLTDPDDVALDNLTTDTFTKVTKQIKRCQSCLLRVRLGCASGDMAVQEVVLAIDLMLTASKIGRCLVSVGANPNSNMGLACINLGVSNLPPTFRTDVANKLLALVEQYKGAWLQRHLAAGLQNSLLVLTATLRRFVPEDEV